MEDSSKSDSGHIDIIELKGFTDSYCVLVKSWDSLFAADSPGQDIFRCIIYNRFTILLQCIKFDDVDTTEELERLIFYVRLSESIKYINRHITVDNWFTSDQLINILRWEKLTYVRIIWKNDFDFHESSLLLIKEKSVVQFAYIQNLILLSYASEEDKFILQVSSMHSLPEQDLEVNKVEISVILFTKDPVEENRFYFKKNLAKETNTSELESRQRNPWTAREQIWEKIQASHNKILTESALLSLKALKVNHVLCWYLM